MSKRKHFSAWDRRLFSMVYQSRVGTATKDTVPMSFMSFMSMNIYFCHKSQTTKCCGNGTKLKTLQINCKQLFDI